MYETRHDGFRAFSDSDPSFPRCDVAGLEKGPVRDDSPPPPLDLPARISVVPLREPNGPHIYNRAARAHRFARAMAPRNFTPVVEKRARADEATN